MMEKEEIYQGLAKTLEKEFGIDADKITRDTNLYTDLDIDSIDAIDLLIQLKQMTGKQMTPDVFKQVRTIGEIVDAVYEELKK
jgi:acyl carrier protein